ncbi:glycosyltransferase family 2 protein [Oceaniglobus ichthyenteri]|uniref:glycosyltransferase family 2 protein n=1 Tax=Oceaniglobus ichthyenteri TaxID=2136177 RepID=UPI000D3B950A|nr:glycosyltransferase [Oceaniglobus ichthyenteri]
MTLSVILPAHNEAGYIGPCLAALLASECPPMQVIVVANGCTDNTGDVARGFARQARDLGHTLSVIETPVGGKLNALTMGDGAATGDIRVYLDADVIVSPKVIAQIATALATPMPRYASGAPKVARAQSAVTRAYARFWQTLPFITHGTPGFGLFAMNAPGRARWGDWPDIISDDTFARLNFAPGERVRVSGSYEWPMVEGFANLVRVRRRQNQGVHEIGAKFPALLAHDDTPGVGLSGAVKRAVRDPVGFGVYAAVSLAVKTPLFRSKNRWARGR